MRHFQIQDDSLILEIPLLRSDFSRHSLTALLSTCGTAHVCFHLSSVMSSVPTRANILYRGGAQYTLGARLRRVPSKDSSERLNLQGRFRNFQDQAITEMDMLALRKKHLKVLKIIERI